MDGPAARGERPGLSTYNSWQSSERPIPDTPEDVRLPLRLNDGLDELDTAFAALQYLPMPVIVLSPFKTVVLANEAMGRLLCLDRMKGSKPGAAATAQLKGQRLAQVGVEALHNDNPVWVNWDVSPTQYHLIVQKRD